MRQYRNSEIGQLRGRLQRIHSVPECSAMGFKTIEFMEMHGMLEYRGRQTFIKAITDRLKSLGYDQWVANGRWTKR